MSPICCFGYVQGRSLAQSVLKLEKADYSCSEDFVIHMWKYETDVVFLLITEEKPEAT